MTSRRPAPVADPVGSTPLGYKLVASGLITSAQLDELLRSQGENGPRLGQLVVQAGAAAERAVLDVLAHHLGISAVNLDRTPSDRAALELVPEAYARANAVLPLALLGRTLTIAMADPDDAHLVAELRVMTRQDIEPLLGARTEVEQAIRNRYQVLPDVGEFVRVFEAQHEHLAPVMTPEMARLSENAPIVQIVNLLVTQGLRDRASDIHIEPKKDRLRIRYRIDGVLTDVLTLPLNVAAGVASRLKIMAELDIVERHRSQDGQIQMEIDGRPIDIRIATVETIWGEKIVLRLLDKTRTILQLHELGMGDDQYQRFRRLLRSPFGMVIVSGPTGSGKTTTLYAGVNELDAVARNIMTIEDPVEYTFEDLNQVQIRKMANMTFANGLKALLRQDPDVILVGEIRDTETAEIAVHSALTGHLVMSSLHATDAAGVLQRFMEMGIESFLISSSVTGVVAQRLVRRTCEHCRVAYDLPVEEAELYERLTRQAGKQVFYRGAGCEHCARTGYHGRVGVFEVLTLSDSIKMLLSAKAPVGDIRAAAMLEGMITMREDAVAKVDQDATTMTEVIRSVYLS